MGATSKFSALFLIIVALRTNVLALDFDYRFYDNGPACDHSSPVSDTYPLNSLGPLSGSESQCLSAPTGINWNALEVDNSLSDGKFELITFCDVNCAGGASSGQGNTYCFAPVPGCAIGSFIIVPT